MYLEIISPGKKLYSGEVRSVKLPGAAGSFGVLNRHAALISSLKKGKVKVVDAEGTHFFDISGGVAEVLNNKLVILAE